ncbi:hypothetical protein ACWEWG_25960 [Streptomyces sp. NPDC003758]
MLPSYDIAEKVWNLPMLLLFHRPAEGRSGIGRRKDVRESASPS